nr:hypothetical protein [Sporosarcina cascadiensis]
MIEKHTLLILENQIKVGIFFEEQKSLPAEITRKTQEAIDLYYETVTVWFKEGVENQYFIDVHPSIAVQTILGSCNWAYKWYSPEGPIQKNELAKIMSRILCDGYKEKGYQFSR